MLSDSALRGAKGFTGSRRPPGHRGRGGARQRAGLRCLRLQLAHGAINIHSCWPFLLSRGQIFSCISQGASQAALLNEERRRGPAQGPARHRPRRGAQVSSVSPAASPSCLTGEFVFSSKVPFPFLQPCLLFLHNEAGQHQFQAGIWPFPPCGIPEEIKKFFRKPFCLSPAARFSLAPCTPGLLSPHSPAGWLRADLAPCPLSTSLGNCPLPLGSRSRERGWDTSRVPAPIPTHGH